WAKLDRAIVGTVPAAATPLAWGRREHPADSKPVGRRVKQGRTRAAVGEHRRPAVWRYVRHPLDARPDHTGGSADAKAEHGQGLTVIQRGRQSRAGRIKTNEAGEFQVAVRRPQRSPNAPGVGVTDDDRVRAGARYGPTVGRPTRPTRPRADGDR